MCTILTLRPNDRWAIVIVQLTLAGWWEMWNVARLSCGPPTFVSYIIFFSVRFSYERFVGEPSISFKAASVEEVEIYGCDLSTV